MNALCFWVDLISILDLGTNDLTSSVSSLVNNWLLYMDLFLLGFFVYRMTWSSSDYFSWQLTTLLYVLVDDQRLEPCVTSQTTVWTQHTVGVCLHIVQWGRLSGELSAICLSGRLMFQSNMRGNRNRNVMSVINTKDFFFSNKKVKTKGNLFL